MGHQKQLTLGDLDVYRDWGFAGDYVKAMVLMLENEQPDDYVIATGKMHSVRDFVDLAFQTVSLSWEKYVVQDEQFFRPADIPALCGDATKAKENDNAHRS